MTDEFPKIERLDQRVVRELTDVSRSSAAKLIESGKVTMDGTVQTKPSHKVSVESKLIIDYRPMTAEQRPKLNLRVLHEDKDCVVVEKPNGVLTHSKGAFNPEATVATWLTSKIAGMDGERAGIVHRLDRATSGVMICAKHPDAMSWLQKQFAQRKVKKTYLAVVKGVPSPSHAIIDMPIERNPKKPQTFRVGSNGKSAVTEYSVTKKGHNMSLLQLKPTTGRTHQLRVHLQERGHPIIGDTLYGGPIADRLYLHAESLELTLPDKSRRTFTVPMPAEFDVKLDA